MTYEEKTTVKFLVEMYELESEINSEEFLIESLNPRQILLEARELIKLEEGLVDKAKELATRSVRKISNYAVKTTKTGWMAAVKTGIKSEIEKAKNKYDRAVKLSKEVAGNVIRTLLSLLMLGLSMVVGVGSLVLAALSHNVSYGIPVASLKSKAIGATLIKQAGGKLSFKALHGAFLINPIKTTIIVISVTMLAFGLVAWIYTKLNSKSDIRKLSSVIDKSSSKIGSKLGTII